VCSEKTCQRLKDLTAFQKNEQEATIIQQKKNNENDDVIPGLDPESRF